MGAWCEETSKFGVQTEYLTFSDVDLSLSIV